MSQHVALPQSPTHSNHCHLPCRHICCTICPRPLPTTQTTSPLPPLLHKTIPTPPPHTHTPAPRPHLDSVPPAHVRQALEENLGGNAHAAGEVRGQHTLRASLTHRQGGGADRGGEGAGGVAGGRSGTKQSGSDHMCSMTAWSCGGRGASVCMHAGAIVQQSSTHWRRQDCTTAHALLSSSIKQRPNPAV